MRSARWRVLQPHAAEVLAMRLQHSEVRFLVTVQQHPRVQTGITHCSGMVVQYRMDD
jgi:hypothetical protein